MVQVKAKPLADPAADYDEDFYLWSYEQAELLRQGRFSEIDLANIVEEIESLGRSDRRALVSAYRVLIQHLLKWQFQPDRRSASWRTTIRTQRTHLDTLEGESPSLAVKFGDHIAKAHADARKLAADETGLPLQTFPERCAYSVEQLRNQDWLPE